MKLVITGALGHIGSSLIHSLRPGECREVILIDNLSAQRLQALFRLPEGIRWRFIEADVASADAGLDEIFSDAHAVVHLAAVTDAESSFGNEERVDSVNFSGTERVARACVAAGCRLLFPSSTSVYGVSHDGVAEDCPQEQLKPQSPYAESKLRAERMLAELGRTAGLRFFCGRFGTIYGPSVGMHFHTAVNRFIWQACLGKPMTVWRTALEQRRPYLDLGDAVEAIRFVIREDLFDGGTYNVATDNLTVQQIVEAICRHVPGARVELVDRRIMNQLSYAVDRAKFEAAGFRFAGDLERGIGDTVKLLAPLVQR
ncbi:MAG TPA: NAD(P)-dependent oxidoreductase [Burkholderiales bacterium]|nr:NAD(P)-dependent oxidoreductase [Burkholderiales bacterium]